MTIDINGRQGIGVAQSQPGADFPLVQPSADIRYLLADVSVTFDQPADQVFTPPFRIHWLSGFGTLAPGFGIPTQNDNGTWNNVCVGSGSIDDNYVAVTPCLPIPRHVHDIMIVDANDQIVFDSTSTDITYTTRTWGSRLRIVTWRHPTDQYVSVVYHTAWNIADDPEPQVYSTYMFPQLAVLDERAITQLPKRVRSLSVVLDTLREQHIEFAAGYNMQIEADRSVGTPGGRQSTLVTFNATPGAGFGVFPDCTPGALHITSINGVAPDATGEFFLSATDCYWFRQPMRIVHSATFAATPQIGLAPGNILTANMPSSDAGTSKNALGWPLNDSIKYAHLQFGNDCKPCCDCPDYVETASYMNAVRLEYSRIGKMVIESRNIYHENRSRWIDTAECITRHPLAIQMLAQVCPYVDILAQICNHTDECLQNVELRIAMATDPVGGSAVEVPYHTFITGGLYRPGSGAPLTTRYNMIGEWPVFKAVFETVQPRQTAHVRFRLEFDDCGLHSRSPDVPYTSLAGLTAKIDNVPLKVWNRLHTAEVLIEASGSHVLDCPSPPDVPSACY